MAMRHKNREGHQRSKPKRQPIEALKEAAKPSPQMYNVDAAKGGFGPMSGFQGEMPKGRDILNDFGPDHGSLSNNFVGRTPLRPQMRDYPASQKGGKR